MNLLPITVQICPNFSKLVLVRLILTSNMFDILVYYFQFFIFQGYPLDLLPITVKGVPSMHICLDFAPELLRQSDMDKQAFTVDLISHLSVQYALPKSFSTARLAVNVLSTLLSGNSLLIVTILRFLGYNRLPKANKTKVCPKICQCSMPTYT